MNSRREAAILIGAAAIEIALLWKLLSHPALGYGREEALGYLRSLGLLAVVPLSAFAAALLVNNRRPTGRRAKLSSFGVAFTGAVSALLAILMIHGAAGVLFIGYCVQSALVLAAWVRVWHAA